MKRLKLLGFAIAVVTLFLAYPLSAQTTPSPVTPGTTTPTRPGRKTPCWQEAGISQSALQKRKQIEETTRGEVQSVCTDSSLTQQEKEQKIHQLHHQAEQQVQALISPQQEQALKSCREQRGEAHMGGMGMHAGGGPCGETTSGTKP